MMENLGSLSLEDLAQIQIAYFTVEEKELMKPLLGMQQKKAMAILDHQFNESLKNRTGETMSIESTYKLFTHYQQTPVNSQ